MRKISLNLEALAVESFVTGEAGRAGTIEGHQRATACSLCGDDGSLSAFNCANCPSNASCAGVQQTCEETCDALVQTCHDAGCQAGGETLPQYFTCADSCGCPPSYTCGLTSCGTCSC